MLEPAFLDWMVGFFSWELLWWEANFNLNAILLLVAKAEDASLTGADFLKGAAYDTSPDDLVPADGIAL